jgi:hypothetical protein
VCNCKDGAKLISFPWNSIYQVKSEQPAKPYLLQAAIGLSNTVFKHLYLSVVGILDRSRMDPGNAGILPAGATLPAGSRRSHGVRCAAWM